MKKKTKRNPADHTKRNTDARKKEIARLTLSLHQVRLEFIRQREALIAMANCLGACCKQEGCEQRILDILNKK